VAAILWAFATPLPHVLIAPNGDLIAVRGGDGRLAIIKKSGDAFAVKEWLAADADARTSADPSLLSGVACDAIGCNARLADGSIVALAMGPEAFAEDCRRAGLVISSRTAPPDCSTMTIDRTVRLRSGALALRRNGAAWEITSARPDGYDRPWARARTVASSSASERTATPPKATKRDARRKPADLEADD
jgi:competence protein ComEC